MLVTKDNELKKNIYDSEMHAIQMATFNILEDASYERDYLVETQKAILNILEDFELEKLKVEDSLREKEVLLKEIHHRVKNNLQITSSLLSLQSNSIIDSHMRELFMDNQNRISSIALVHEKLYSSNDLSQIDFSEYIESLALALFNSLSVKSDRIQLKVSKYPIFLKIDIAVPLGLIINELITNCIKHAFPNGRHGEISISFNIEKEKFLSLSIADNGIGLPKDFDAKNSKTLGLHLVQKLSKQIDAHLVIKSTDWTTFIIEFSGPRRTP